MAVSMYVVKSFNLPGYKMFTIYLLLELGLTSSNDVLYYDYLYIMCTASYVTMLVCPQYLAATYTMVSTN